MEVNLMPLMIWFGFESSCLVGNKRLTLGVLWNPDLNSFSVPGLNPSNFPQLSCWQFHPFNHLKCSSHLYSFFFFPSYTVHLIHQGILLLILSRIYAVFCHSYLLLIVWVTIIFWLGYWKDLLSRSGFF